MTEQSDLEKIVLTRLIRLNAIVSGIVTGLISGGILFIATIWLVIKGGEVVGPHLALLGQFFAGYRVTYFGSVVGFFYGFITGFIIGFTVAILYNWLLRVKKAP